MSQTAEPLVLERSESKKSRKILLCSIVTKFRRVLHGLDPKRKFVSERSNVAN
jgi:hypothetical protein